jgi:hypothetical protein
MRRFLFIAAFNILGIAFAIAIGEGVARLAFPTLGVSSGSASIADEELGWVPEPNIRDHTVNAEYTVDTEVNALGLYDFMPPADGNGRRLSLLALGDSHTAATGVSTGDTWPKVVQRDLEQLGVANWVHNGAVHGYSLDQYLVRFRRLAPLVKPRIVLIGFSMATDFYDIGRTRDGTFVYCQFCGRVYFSLDDNKQLIEHRELVGKTVEEPVLPVTSYGARDLRGLLDNLALYRIAKRSELAMWAAMRLKVQEESLWPGLDTGLKLDLTPDDRRRIDLAGRLIGEIAAEARQIGAIPVLVHIPYLAQIYDSIWQRSFGSVPGYDRDLPSARLAAFAEQHGLLYADAYPVMRDYVSTHGESVNYRYDGHPNVTGQRLIGITVSAALQKCLKRNPEMKPDVCR